jgi:hypothetical protein
MEVTDTTFKVQELEKWASGVTVTQRVPGFWVEVLDKSSMSDAAKKEEQVILETISV